jgi:hypothetical protein
MEGATKSGMLCADEILARTDMLQKFKGSKKLENAVKAASVIDNFSKV